MGCRYKDAAYDTAAMQAVAGEYQHMLSRLCDIGIDIKAAERKCRLLTNIDSNILALCRSQSLHVLR